MTHWRLTDLRCEGLVFGRDLLFPQVDLGKRFKVYPAYIPRPATNGGSRLHLAAVDDEPAT